MNRRHLTAAASTALIAAALSSAATPAQAAPQTCRGQDATIVSDAVDVPGTTGADVIVATRLNAIVHAREGADVICLASRGTVYGGPGNDVVDDIGGVRRATVYGGRGNDRLLVDGFRGDLFGGPGDDVLGTPGADSSNDYFPGAGDDLIRMTDRGPHTYGETIRYRDSQRSIDVDLPAGQIIGADIGTDTFTGYAEIVQTGSGDDTIHGYRHSPTWVLTEAGDDTITTGDANDTVLDGDGSDVVHTGAGDDRLWRIPSTEPDTVDVADLGAGDDYLDGHASGHYDLGTEDDTAQFTYLNDLQVDAGPGKDLLRYEARDSSPERLTLDMRTGVVQGQLGTLTGFQDFWSENFDVTAAHPSTVTATSGPNYFYLEQGNDVIHGLGGDDTIKGGSGNDTLDGGSGRDLLKGQQGVDTCTAGEQVTGCER